MEKMGILTKISFFYRRRLQTAAFSDGPAFSVFLPAPAARLLNEDRRGTKNASEPSAILSLEKYEEFLPRRRPLRGQLQEKKSKKFLPSGPFFDFLFRLFRLCGSFSHDWRSFQRSIAGKLRIASEPFTFLCKGGTIPPCVFQ
jgi:hypothetical protein